MKRLLLLLWVAAFAFSLWAAENFISFKRSDDAVRITSDNPFAIVYDKDSEPVGVGIAMQNLAEDFNRVCGHKPMVLDATDGNTTVVAGTLGHSKYIQRYVDAGKIDPEMLNGKWEKYIITLVGDTLVIAGSDRRGTIFGIYELSRQMGVNPWYWWADVPVDHHDDVFARPGLYTDGEPAVKYRGIFINDEWPSFGTWANNQFGGINSKMYANMFELLLRLKANYLWPAMWDSAFNEDDPETQRLANDYGIVMGTSHHEPMMRAHKEYTRRRDQIGAWDFRGNRDNIIQFFSEGVKRAKDYDNIITIGMRGDGDVALGKDDAECMETLTDVIATQR